MIGMPRCGGARYRRSGAPRGREEPPSGCVLERRNLERSGEEGRVARMSTPYIVGRHYDWMLFLLPPVLSLALGVLIAGTAFDTEVIRTGADEATTRSSLWIGILIHAHLIAVFVRSHGNPQIFRLYPERFIAAPILLYVAMLASSWVLVCVSVLATFWDVYHSALQTFGFSRIYDGRAGNSPELGRRLDWWLNQLLYCGPILAGVTMIDHFEDFGEFASLESSVALFFTRVPAFMVGHQAYVTWAVLAAGACFLVYYVLAYVRLYRAGYVVSFQKVYLLASTGLCSLIAWGFNPWGTAFFIMNLFHAVQYFGIVWAQERNTLERLLGVAKWSNGRYVALAALIAGTFGYGVAAEVWGGSFAWFWPLTLVVSLMHFWYDGFIWSVRKSQV